MLIGLLIGSIWPTYGLKFVKKLKDSNCDLKSKGKQRTISPPDLQKSLGLSYINLVESRYVFYGFDNEIQL